ncbi:MAG: glucose-1-phosphate adenylyltransferase [Candidatus Omnitrophica bacterium]|nr:glucose-1-phosphate adenylyltransferase [Candidatus Omnitrophota bacterium]
MRKVLTFIMAGGKGERLWPLTRDRVKPAVPFGGIYRIIDFTLSNCINSGLRRIFILTQYKSASLQRHIRLGWNILPSELGQFIELLPAQQRVGESWYLGTADAIFQNLYTIDEEKPDEVLILAGDHIYKMNYYQMIDYHRKTLADLTIGIVEVEKERASNLGMVEVDDNFRLIRFKEKPSSSELEELNKDKVYVSMGIYAFNTEVLKQLLVEDSQDTSSTHDFGRDMLPKMLKRGYRIYGYNFVDENKKEAKYWRDIGTIDAYYEANMDLVQVEPLFNLYDKDWPIRTYQEQFPPAKTVFAGDEITGRIGLVLDSLIANGCIISGGRVKRSILSYNVRINSFSEVYDSILMEGVNVGRYAKIRRTIVDKDVDIPKGEVIGYDLEQDKKRFFVTESGIVVVAKRTHI